MKNRRIKYLCSYCSRELFESEIAKGYAICGICRRSLSTKRAGESGEKRMKHGYIVMVKFENPLELPHSGFP